MSLPMHGRDLYANDCPHLQRTVDPWMESSVWHRIMFRSKFSTPLPTNPLQDKPRIEHHSLGLINMFLFLRRSISNDDFSST
jgi:hypothetical protein